MKRSFAFLALAAFVAFFASVASFAAGSIPLFLPGGQKLDVELAVTPEEQERGLMHKMELPSDYGMLFIFEKEGVYQFWMKDTWVDLDILFIGKDKKINKIYRRVPRSYPDTLDSRVARVRGLGRYVLELPAGAAKRYKLKEGQKLKFEMPKGEIK